LVKKDATVQGIRGMSVSGLGNHSGWNDGVRQRVGVRWGNLKGDGGAAATARDRFWNGDGRIAS
jgi:hypothetical protein